MNDENVSLLVDDPIYLLSVKIAFSFSFYIIGFDFVLSH